MFIPPKFLSIRYSREKIILSLLYTSSKFSIQSQFKTDGPKYLLEP